MENNTWQLQEAKAKLSEVISASQYEPQTITVRGKKKSILLSCEEYMLLKQRTQSGKKKTAGSFGEFLAKSPLCGANLKIERNSSSMREIKW